MFAAMMQSMTMPKPKPVVLPPSMSEIDLELDRLEKEEYQRVAKRLSLEVPVAPVKPVLSARVLQWLKDNNTGVYDRKEVDNFLDRQCRIETRKLRKAGDFHSLSWSWTYLTPKVSSRRWINITEKYTKPVPLHVLHLVEKMSDAFPGQLDFVVSDYRVVNPDPFLMVIADERGFVIAHWDEPSFKGKAK